MSIDELGFEVVAVEVLAVLLRVPLTLVEKFGTDVKRR